MSLQSVQIITYEGEFTQHIKNFLSYSGLTSTNYHTVSIVGSQSTGKSTLLNLVFGTDFDTLDPMRERNQTTKGIHLGINLDFKTLIIDIEGTDSLARGEDGAAFEAMAALFALSVSDILMVNMWTSEIGRYKAASIGLLKTIFEANLRLFSQERKKRILFLLRDFNDKKDNLFVLKQQMSKTVEEVWEQIHKPSEYAMSHVFDYFDFDFKTISTKDFKPKEFKADIDELKERFRDEEKFDYLFRMKNTDIPIDGVPLYYQTIWDVVKNDKEINIPSQKEMLANLRCNELKIEAYEWFKNSMSSFAKQVGREIVKDFGKEIAKFLKKGIDKYDEKAANYYEVVYRRFREELIGLALEQSKDLFRLQMKFILESYQKKFKVLLEKKIQKNKTIENFNEIIADIYKEIFDGFNIDTESSLLQNSDWDIDEYRSSLSDFMNEKCAFEKEKELALLEKEVNLQLTGGKFSNQISRALEQMNEETMWENLKNIQREHMESLEKHCKAVLEGLGFTDNQIEQHILNIKVQFYESMKSKINKYCDHLVDHLVRHFNQLFLKDENGVPRTWDRENIQEIYAVSKAKTVKVLENFRFFQLLPDWDYALDDVNYEELLNEDRFRMINDSFVKDAEIAYKEAVHLKEFGYSRTHIPTWFWLILLLLGWNEILWVLRSPVILYPLIFIGAIIALAFSMGFGSTIINFVKTLYQGYNFFRSN
ncbi:SEY1_1 [Blepharisma stoltei]|uniref:Protein SEY1 homolog n=1 Tax=Blepharisma stoltei TaxID=1481888 RepID=A0AAU9IQ85_9CILI|nr:unnamed protein product [Blepharisma stoltei]